MLNSEQHDQFKQVCEGLKIIAEQSAVNARMEEARKKAKAESLEVARAGSIRSRMTGLTRQAALRGSTFLTYHLSQRAT